MGQTRTSAAVVAPARQDLAKGLVAQAYKLYQAGRYVEAIGLYRRAIAARPDYADALNGLGMAYRKLERFDEAAAVYRKALALQPDAAFIWGNLGNVFKDAQAFDECFAAHDRALELKPSDGGLIYNRGIALAAAGRLEEALSCYDRALELRPGDPDVNWDRARVLLHLGDFRRGWEAYEWRWRLAEHRPRVWAKPEWDGGPFAGKRLLLYTEQGFGDTIQCVRYLPQVKALGGTVIIECQPGLMPLVAAVPGVDEIHSKELPPPEHDLRFSLLSLPRLFTPSLDTLPGPMPYLHAPADRHGKFAEAMARGAGKLKVGIVWSGSVTFKGNRTRAARLDAFLRHLVMPGVQLYSLQKGPPEAELDALGGCAPLIDLAPLLDDFADTAAALEQLDLVIMTDSSVAHLAGAMNRPVWVLLGFSAHWLWLRDRDDSPWYPSMRFFRQTTPGDWDEAFGRVRAALAETYGVAVPPPVTEASDGLMGRGETTTLKRCRDGVMLFPRDEPLVGRSLAVYGEYAAGEMEMLRRLSGEGDTVVDVGAGIGAHALFLARQVGRVGIVHALEPDRAAFQTLCANVALNEVNWVQCHPTALDEVDALDLASCRLLRIGAAPVEALAGARDTIRRLRPALYVRNQRRDRSPEVIAALRELGYQAWWHTPPLFNSANAARQSVDIFAGLRGVNLLALPAGGRVGGLRPVAGPDDWWE